MPCFFVLSNLYLTYQVGYARVNINPYVVEDDPSSGTIADLAMTTAVYGYHIK